MSFADTRNAISFPGSVAGPMPLILPDGREMCPFGLVRALASLSARQVKDWGLQISGISGQRGSTSSASAALTSSLASRLAQRFDTAGSTLFRQTWKRKATPSGQPYWAHTASAPRTSGSGCTSWPAPCQQDGPNGGPAQGVDRLPGAAALTAWPTAGAGDEKWRISTPEAAQRRKDSGEQVSLECAAWLAAPWATPAARDFRDGNCDLEKNPVKSILGRQVLLSNARTEGRGSLNPAFSRWLMGYPPEWDVCAVTVMPFVPKRQPPSSAPGSKRRKS